MDLYEAENPPILELVTKAMDESDDDAEQNVRPLITELVSIANYIEARVIDKDKRIKVKDLPGVKVAGADHKNYVGVDPRSHLLRALA
jgi:hypothetical protein